jgi:hypothetical protein
MMSVRLNGLRQLLAERRRRWERGAPFVATRGINDDPGTAAAQAIVGLTRPRHTRRLSAGVRVEY